MNKNDMSRKRSRIIDPSAIPTENFFQKKKRSFYSAMLPYFAKRNNMLEQHTVNQSTSVEYFMF
jgi:hypothetical protein